MKTLYFTISFCIIGLFANPSLWAHCEIPCGIYGDKGRFQTMEEHIATIEKSIDQINKLSTEGTMNYNQIVRWVNNKEKHATELQHIVSQYFLTQRVKPVEAKETEAFKNYQQKLTLLHKMIVYAMKTKQSLDPANVAELRNLLSSFHSEYMGAHVHK
jgi:nickel superoxide dismutase